MSKPRRSQLWLTHLEERLAPWVGPSALQVLRPRLREWCEELERDLRRAEDAKRKAQSRASRGKDTKSAP